ncbi:hypothetical protein HPB50_023021 [Hyalomma asiaticum]|uniref:Uncharacterized protein n=1 Tax=Hyalomma asiaticum TaxID=266040 RepID=A0ACB7S9F0_HYAAI|nr:hypothetical protein HPB50_023021 [Hyalomma asiaticum]
MHGTHTAHRVTTRDHSKNTAEFTAPVFRMQGNERKRHNVRRSKGAGRSFSSMHDAGPSGRPPCLKFTAAATQVALRRTERVGFFEGPVNLTTVVDVRSLPERPRTRSCW